MASAVRRRAAAAASAGPTPALPPASAALAAAAAPPPPASLLAAPSRSAGADPASGPPPAPTVAAIVAWNLCSVAVILYNSHVVARPDGAFQRPVTLVLLHMAANTLLTQALAAAGLLAVPALGWGAYLRAVPALGLLFAGSLACSLTATSRLGVATVQMVKALAPLISLLTVVAAGDERPRPSLLAAALLMSAGVGISTLGAPARLDALGLALQVCALLCESLRMVGIQRTIQARLPRANPLAALALFAPVCAACLLPLSLYVEPGALAELAAAPAATHLLLLGNAAAACALNGCSVWLLSQPSGPLLLTFVGVVKDFEIFPLVYFLRGTRIRYIQVAGYALALLGVNLYNAHKSVAGEAPLGSLLRVATTNRMAAVMAAGVLVMLCIAGEGAARATLSPGVV
jgi:drug/metabolite transporter (DMT)-like permease